MRDTALAGAARDRRRDRRVERAVRGAIPATGRQVLIEMNPRVSRSSALASKATGFPIAKIAALLAVGYRLDEIVNDITRRDAGVVRADARLRGREDPAVRLREVPRGRPAAHLHDEVGRRGHGDRPHVQGGARQGAGAGSRRPGSTSAAEYARPGSTADPLAAPRATAPRRRLHLVERALARGRTRRRRRGGVAASTRGSSTRSREVVEEARRRCAGGRCTTLAAVRASRREAARAVRRAARGARPARPRPRCAATARRWASRRCSRRSTRAAGEFPARTPYHYSTYEEETEVRPAERPRVVILGAGPNRIGQGIEFDYACVHAAFALEEAGFESVMVNSNPETVSTDYDTSSRLYFEPLSAEDVLAVCRAERPVGVIAQLGGQTPLQARADPAGRGLRDPRHLAGGDRPGRGSREVRARSCTSSRSPRRRTARRARWRRPARSRAQIGYPVVVRPSYVLGGRAMEIVYDDEELETLRADGGGGVARPPGADRPVPRGRDRGRRRRRVRRARRRLHRRR